MGAGANVRFDETINSTGGARALTVNTNAATIFGGAVGGTSALASLTTNAGGTTSIGGNVTTTGTQTYGDAVTLTSATTLASSGNAAIALNSTVDGAQTLAVNTTGATTFAGSVGSTTALTSLTTNAGGTTSIGGNVTTTGVQTYNDAVTLTGNSILTGTTPTFASTVSGGGFDLTLNFSGTTTVNGANFTGIRNLATGNGGTTQLTGAITTTGTQTYGDAVTLTGATTLASSGNAAIALNGTINGAQTLAVNTTGATTFAGAVGSATALTSLTTNAGGTTAINGGSVRTTGNQTYNDNVSMGAPTTLVTTANGNITSNGSVVANGHLLTLAAGLGNVVMQNAANDFATVSVTSATNVALRDANAIDLGVSTIGANLTVTSGGAVTDSGAISVAGATTINAGASNDVTLDNANDFGGNISVQSGRNVRLNDINSLTLDLSTFSTLTATAAGTVTLAGQLTATGTGDAIVLSGGRFVNSAGASALSVPASSRWLVWSSNPNPFGGATPDNRGGLAYDLKQYNATFGVTPVAQATGNGFLYSLAPTITPGLTGTVSKVYDATTSAPLVAANFTPTSGVDGDVIALSGTGAYDNPNVAGSPTKLVTATGIAATVTSSIADGSKPVYGYTLTSTTASANIGEITPAPLTITGDTTSSLYTSSLQTNTFSTTGLLGSDSVTSVATLASGTNVGTYADNLTSATGTGLTNYTIGYVNGSLTITPAPLTITGDTTSSLYTSNLQTNTFTTSGLLGSDSVTSVATLASGTNVGTYADNLTSATGTGLTNYTIGYVNGSLTITPAPLTITGDTTSSLYTSSLQTNTFSTTGLLGSDSVTSVATLASGTNVGTYADNLTSATGTGLTNYTIGYVNGSLTITPAPLTITGDTTSSLYTSSLQTNTFTHHRPARQRQRDQRRHSGQRHQCRHLCRQPDQRHRHRPHQLHHRLRQWQPDDHPGTADHHRRHDQQPLHQQPPDQHLQHDGLLGSDSVTSVATLASGTNVGTYADNLTSATGTGLTNYTIGYVNGSLTITPAPLTITGDTTSSLYTSSLQTNTFTHDAACSAATA